MSQQQVPVVNQQINANSSAVTILTDALGVGNPPDITKLIIANTSATASLVTISDGINNYYYCVPAGGTVIDGELYADVRSTKWTAQVAQSINSIYISATYD
jgi:hypothetical protein